MSDITVAKADPPPSKRRSSNAEFWAQQVETLMAEPNEWLRFGPFATSGSAASALRTGFGHLDTIERTTRTIDGEAFGFARYVWREEPAFGGDAA